MFGYFLALLRNIKGVIISVLSVLYGFIPDAMKARFAELRTKGLFIGMFQFVLGIFKNIYFLIAIPALIITYRFFKILQEKGIIDGFKNIVNTTINSSLKISTECFPLILDFGSFISCINAV
jgi:hypothetical protein